MDNDTHPRDLPEAFEADDPAEHESRGQFGAGHLVESAVPKTTREARRGASEGTDGGEASVDEASEESFPGSDPPTWGSTPTE